MNNTPETDAFQSSGKAHYMALDFARKLERERDEARESLKHITEYGTEEINAAVELRQKLATSLLERDEAREAIRALAEHGEVEIQRFTKERDEAREAIVGWEKKWNMAIEMTAIAENERDLLKEDLINLEDQRDLAMKVLKRLEAQLAQKEQ